MFRCASFELEGEGGNRGEGESESEGEVAGGARISKCHCWKGMDGKNPPVLLLRSWMVVVGRRSIQ
jgi:hypothetical protein